MSFPVAVTTPRSHSRFNPPLATAEGVCFPFRAVASFYMPLVFAAAVHFRSVAYYQSLVVSLALKQFVAGKCPSGLVRRYGLLCVLLHCGRRSAWVKASVGVLHVLRHILGASAFHGIPTHMWVASFPCLASMPCMGFQHPTLFVTAFQL